MTIYTRDYKKIGPKYALARWFYPAVKSSLLLLLRYPTERNYKSSFVSILSSFSYETRSLETLSLSSLEHGMCLSVSNTGTIRAIRTVDALGQFRVLGLSHFCCVNLTKTNNESHTLAASVLR